MKSATLAAALVAVGVLLVATVRAAPKAGDLRGDSPSVASLAKMMEKELKWGMTRAEVIDLYNRTGGLIDREYSARLAKLQPGVDQQQVEADRDNRKVNFERSYTPFGDTPTGFDVTPIHSEYTYRNDEAVMRLFRDGKTRIFFFIKDRLWKLYDEVPLSSDGPLGASFQDAVAKLNALFSVAGRIRAANPAQALERTEADWQDQGSHLRAIDRSGEHIVGVVMEDKNTLQNLVSLRSHKAVDPFAIDPAIAAVTRGGISDPNAMHAADAGAGKTRTARHVSTNGN
ncbi:MAG: hypothetical protein ABTD50_00325 [Polyangiaceae bacterium]|jgi:hypothetical protein